MKIWLLRSMSEAFSEKPWISMQDLLSSNITFLRSLRGDLVECLEAMFY